MPLSLQGTFSGGEGGGGKEVLQKARGKTGKDVLLKILQVASKPEEDKLWDKKSDFSKAQQAIT